MSVRLVDLGVSQEALPEYGPVNPGNLGGHADGLRLQALHPQVVPWASLRSLSVFVAHPQQGGKTYLVVVARGFEQAFLVEAERIGWAEFPLPPAPDVTSGLRNFARYLCQLVPGLFLDRPTYTFLTGDEPQRLGRSLQAHTSALCLALAQQEAPAPPLPPAPPYPPSPPIARAAADPSPAGASPTQPVEPEPSPIASKVPTRSPAEGSRPHPPPAQAEPVIEAEQAISPGGEESPIGLAPRTEPTREAASSGDPASGILGRGTESPGFNAPDVYVPDDEEDRDRLAAVSSYGTYGKRRESMADWLLYALRGAGPRILGLFSVACVLAWHGFTAVLERLPPDEDAVMRAMTGEPPSPFAREALVLYGFQLLGLILLVPLFFQIVMRSAAGEEKLLAFPNYLDVRGRAFDLLTYLAVTTLFGLASALQGAVLRGSVEENRDPGVLFLILPPHLVVQLVLASLSVFVVGALASYRQSSLLLRFDLHVKALGRHWTGLLRLFGRYLLLCLGLGALIVLLVVFGLPSLTGLMLERAWILVNGLIFAAAFLAIYLYSTLARLIGLLFRRNIQDLDGLYLS